MNTTNLQDLFGNASATGDVDPNTANLAITIAKGNPKISNLGVNVDDIQDSEVVSFHMLLDDSHSIKGNPSMGIPNNVPNVIEGQRIFLDALMGAKKKHNVMVAMDCLNDDGNIDLPYTLLVDNAGNLAIPYLNSSNYDPNGGTPLYDRVAEAATQMLAKIQQIRAAGMQERSNLIVVTDGADLHSKRRNAADVKKLIGEILMTETNSVYFIGIDDKRTDFKRIAQEMGVPDNNIWTPDAMDEKAIRRAFQTMSQSASAAASGNATGGFGN